MTLEEIKSALNISGYAISQEKRTGNNTGSQLRLENGAIVNIWDNGNFNVQGKNTDEVNEVLGNSPKGTAEIKKEEQQNNKVFVVYGHDKAARHNLEAMLRRWGLEPLILDQLPSEGQTIIEKLESNTAQVEFAVVLATPDDIGYRSGHEDETAYRARQNVVLELGMLLSRLGRKKVAILLNQQENMERPSDIQGLIYIPYKDDLEKEAGLILAKEMVGQGYNIDVAKI